MMFGTSIIDDPNLRGHCASLDTGSIDMTETLVVRELAVDLEKINMMTFDQIDDFEIAEISAWCRKHGYTCHVSLRGQLELREKSSARELMFVRRR
jgi:hypothetical protein